MKRACDGATHPYMAAIRALRGVIWNQTATAIEAVESAHPPGDLVLAPDPLVRFAHADGSLAPPLGPPRPPPHAALVVAPCDALTLAQLALEAGYQRVAILVPSTPSLAREDRVVSSGRVEDDILRRTDLARHLACSPHGLPIPPDACLLAHEVTAFRGPEKSGYPFLDRTFCFEAILAAPSCFPPLAPSPAPCGADAVGYRSPRDRQAMRTLVRAIVASALEVQADALVLSAFGCGVHGHPPQEVASFFQDALTRAPIGVALFGIYDDPHHRGPHNPDGNMRPFRRWLLPDEPQSPRLDLPVYIPPPLLSSLPPAQ